MEIYETQNRTYGMGSNPNGGAYIRVYVTEEEVAALRAAGGRFHEDGFNWADEAHTIKRVIYKIPATMTAHVEGRPVHGGDNPAYVKAMQMISA